jgi:uncharacterized protein (TIGR02246 family)
MKSHQFLVLTLILVTTGLLLGLRAWVPGQNEALAAPQQSTQSAPQRTPPVSIKPSATSANSPEAGIKSATADYVKVFNAKDAKAAAALWTENGQYIGVDGEEINGRTAIEKALAEDFKAFPKATMQIEVISIRPISHHTALVEAVVKVKKPGEPEPNVTRYSALHVLEDGVWRAASVREWIPNLQLSAANELLSWLVGDWTAKGAGGNITISYTWNENKSFLIGKYSITKEGKGRTSGTEYLRGDPNGGIRSWTFDDNGTFSGGVWQHEGKHWIDESVGTLPEGTVIESVNLLIPKGEDQFCWQTSERTANGMPLPMLPPIKVTRVKAGGK